MIWIAFWIFARDGQSKESLIENGNPNPTRDEITDATNVVLLAWLGASFFSMFIGCELLLLWSLRDLEN